MIEKDEVYTMSDGKEYFIINSIMYNNSNYVILGEVSASEDKIVGDPVIMFNNTSEGALENVTDPELLLKLAVEFGNSEGMFDF